jgi:hypothetical protein
MGNTKSSERSVTTLGKPPLRATQHSPEGITERELRAKIQEFGRLLRHDFAAEIERDARRFKRRVVWLLGAELPPGPGRPRRKAVTLAIELRGQGKSWQQIYLECLPKSLVGAELQLAQSGLRSAVRSRRTAGRRRKSPPILSANKT